MGRVLKINIRVKKALIKFTFASLRWFLAADDQKADADDTDDGQELQADEDQ